MRVLREAKSRGQPFHLILADMWTYVPLGSQAEPPADGDAGEPSEVEMPPGSTANNGVPIGTPPGSPSEDKDPSGVPPGFQRVVTFDLLESLASEPQLLARLGSGAGSDHNRGGRQPLPVVFLTTALHTDATRCRAANIPFFVPKPFKRSALQRCICRALGLPQVRKTHKPSAPSPPPAPLTPSPPPPVATAVWRRHPQQRNRLPRS